MSKDVIVFDTEIVPSHFLFAAKNLTSGNIVTLWGDSSEDMQRLGALMRNPNYRWVGFNSTNFDMPLIAAAASGFDVPYLKAMADDIIAAKKPAWMTYRDYGIMQLRTAGDTDIDHIDLIEPAPGVFVSLKLYGGRMNSPSLVDMPFHHDDWLTPEQAVELKDYCINDLDETERLYNKLLGAIGLRDDMSSQFGINMMSKSDGQMAEAIIIKELNLFRAKPTPVPRTVQYRAPQFIQPHSPVLKELLHTAQSTEFKVNQGNGAVELPEFLKTPIAIGRGVYQMGIGGLHSQHDRCISYVGSYDFVIKDYDVGSFYPNLILNAGIVPRGLGTPFLALYGGFVAKRMAAKHSGDKLVANAYKLACNSTFGKLGSKFSKIYAPDLMLAVTLTGQFYLLTIIDALNDMGVNVISANTDGITCAGSPTMIQKATDYIMLQGWLTNFEFEEVEYSSISFKDVNNYVAVKRDGGVKSKGLYAESGLQKNPSNEVCSVAIRAYLEKGSPLDETIYEHDEFADFLQVRTVNGGAVEGDVLLGRVARWYYSTDPSCANGLRYKTNGNLVPKSTGGRACMKIPNSFPPDLDYERYVNEAVSHLSNMGVNYVHR